MIVIIDYGMGNLRSIMKKFEMLKIPAVISSDLNVISDSSKLILPGVGHFAQGMDNLKKSGLVALLNRKVIQDKTPILGVCLGMQLMANWSEEGDAEGLGWLNAKVLRFRHQEGSSKKFRVPHVGWNTIQIVGTSCPLLTGVENNSRFYFTHSYHLVCEEEANVIATTDYGYDFVSVAQYSNVFGTQFHPEKSHQAGLKIYENFVNYL